jgi:uncharacterized membrane protein YhaH (DUF805 family)
LGALLRREVKVACYDWVSGLLIGLMPLLAHLLILFAGKPEHDWNSHWAPDILFISISNSGMAALSVFIRSIGGEHVVKRFTPLTTVVWVLLLLCFALASMLYGVDVSGADNGNSWKVATGLVILSGICSLNFEIALAESRLRDKEP